MTDNIILVHAYLESGCSQADGEVRISWKPINFMIYSSLFQGMAEQAAEEWLSTFQMEPETHYEAIFVHVVENDGGAILGEYFAPVDIVRSLKEGKT